MREEGGHRRTNSYKQKRSKKVRGQWIKEIDTEVDRSIGRQGQVRVREMNVLLLIVHLPR